MNLIGKLRTYIRLGVGNGFRVVLYTLRLRSGVLRRKLPIQAPVAGPFIDTLTPSQLAQTRRALSNKSPAKSVALFGHIDLPLDTLPNWQQSQLTGTQAIDSETHWTQLADFGLNIGDVKGVWEPSRFTWLPTLAQAYLATEKKQYIDQANEWIADWSLHNPANQGINWKCAQEASFRVLHLAAVFLLLKQPKPSAACVTFITQHVHRILPTLGYAKAQDNNHGTSEAAALLVAALWMQQGNVEQTYWQQVENLARKYLDERINRLIMEDGSFSQHSVTYHRLMLDSLSFVELFRRFLNASALSASCYRKLQLASTWLFEMTDSASGDAPNLGANDGAHILNFFHAEYRDFRYSVALACLVFNAKVAYTGGVQCAVQQMFELSANERMRQTPHLAMSQGGYAITRNSKAWAMLRAPIFHFRPSQADALHLDFWYKGENVLRDAGSFSYNTEQCWLDYFSSSAAHNTIDFDDLPQMQKLSRFLFADWPTASHFQCDTQQANQITAAYSLWHGAQHKREVHLSESELRIVDTISGFAKNARLRWRLIAKEWQIHRQSLQCADFSITVTATKPLAKFALVAGFESLYYGVKSKLPVLEVELRESAQITTIISWT